MGAGWLVIQVELWPVVVQPSLVATSHTQAVISSTAALVCQSWQPLLNAHLPLP